MGAVELSAVLCDRETAQLYPIYWQRGEGTQRLSRLPAIAYFAAEQLMDLPNAPTAVGDRALKLGMAAIRQTDSAATGLLLGNFQPYLNLVIPYVSGQTQTWEPVLQWSDQQALPLEALRQAIASLLTLLQEHSPQATCLVEGLDATAFQAALADLGGVVIGYPAGYADAYCFNVREAILATGLVRQPEQIFCIEEAVATLLAEFPLPAPSLQSEALLPLKPSPGLGHHSLGQTDHGSTLVLHTGTMVTELLLVDLPSDFHTVLRDDVSIRSVSYGAMAIDQDIICQLFYPSVWGWRHLGSPRLDLPLPGEADLPVRHPFQQRLRSHMLGRDLLRGARLVKRTLQQQDTVTVNVNEQQWVFTQQDLRDRIIVPYMQLLNRELNILLIQAGMDVQAVQRVICAGEIGLFPAIAQWLKQKFPHAKILPGVESLTAVSSAIAAGLAKLPLYPQLLDSTRHQYSAYFLLHELLRILPSQPVSFGRILQILENQGINTQACQKTILSLLEGELPAGLVPAPADIHLLTSASQQNSDYQALTAMPIFSRQGNQVYGVNANQRDQLQDYLNGILKHSRQTWDEPLTVNLEVQATI